MGNLKSCLKNDDRRSTNDVLQCNILPTNAKTWSVVYRGNLNNWISCAEKYGFEEFPLLCQNIDCDRETVCLQIIQADLDSRKKVLQISKNINRGLITVPYAENKKFRNLIDIEGYNINLSALVYRENMVLLLCKHVSDFVWNSVFPLLDLNKKAIKSVLYAPEKNMTINQAEISPDLSKTVILFFHVRDYVTRTFGHELFLYENENGDILDKIFVNAHINPSVAFDPQCDWTRIVILGYNISNDSQENDLVIFSLSQKIILKKSKLSAIKTFGRGHFNILYSKDGQLVILQKLTSGRFTDTYIFDSTELTLLKYIPTTLPGIALPCTTSYEPVFSKCGGYMGLVHHDNPKKFQHEATIQVYQLPRVLNLQFQTRIVIIQNLYNMDCINRLNLPPKLLNYLKFKPVEI